MELATEEIKISKIRDGLFIGDKRAAINIDLLMQFKISHIINATGIPLPYSFESIGIKYLTINWSENPPENTIILSDELISNIILFIDEANNEGEGLLGFSGTGKNRICAVIVLYLITKYNWPLKKCLEYIKLKKNDISINNFYMNQLESYEKEFFSKNNLIQSPSNWNDKKIEDKDELIMRNTYMNEIKKDNIANENEKENNLNENKGKVLRNVEWGDNKKVIRQMAQPGLIHYNIYKDLFFKKDIEDITEHLNKKPLRSCIKKSLNMNPNNNNINSINKVKSINRKKTTKIYLAADVHTVKTSKKEDISEYNSINNNDKKEDKQHQLLLTQLDLNEKEEDSENKPSINKKNIFEDILLTEKSDENNNLLQIEEEKNHKNDKEKNDDEEKNVEELNFDRNDEIKIERNEIDKIENLEKISDNIFLTNTDYKNNERNLKEKEKKIKY